MAIADCLDVLVKLNHELNGELPSAGFDCGPELPRSLVYSISEIIRMIRECRTDDANRAAWRIETAWLAVLAGDIDDILEHVAGEEASRLE
ncbi:MAG: hypothetical protein HKN07_08120 [Acidimicrobiia bacterium]|nr:hypothetical protein [Acidimicrobiia bacterium]